MSGNASAAHCYRKSGFRPIEGDAPPGEIGVILEL